MARFSIAILLLSSPPFASPSIDLNLAILGSSYDGALLQSAIANLTNATLVTMQPPQPDAVTGLVCQLYFPNVTRFYRFQLVHIVRVRAEITSPDDTVALIKLQYMLPAMVSNFATVYILSSNVHGAVDEPWYTSTFIEMPQYVSQYLLVACGVLLLMLLVSSVLLVCSMDTPTIQHAVVVTTAPTAPPLPPQPKIEPPQPRKEQQPKKDPPPLKMPDAWGSTWQ